MSTLFNNSNAEGGFRLRYFEVFNWGTFNKKVYKIQPDGRSSLLTGGNGSGKTTLVDAMLTLLVPTSQRFYNQSSGAEAKKDRDENSYFWGHFGKTYSDADERSKTEQLRTKSDNTYSVLLACFQNAGTLHTITLVQIRWYSNGIIKKLFIVSPYQLNVEEHFGKGKFDMKGEWKKRLVKQFPKTDIFDSFKEYATRFSGIFGLREKALPLFNQTVGIKVLGDLTQFVRDQMLEEPGAEEQFLELYNHYIDLLQSHKAIQKDEKQLSLLEPIVEKKQQLSELNQTISILTFIQLHCTTYFSQLERDLLGKEIKIINEEINLLNIQNERLAEEIQVMEGQQAELIKQKGALNIENQIAFLQKDIDNETKDKNRKKRIFDQYIQVTGVLGLKVDIDENVFLENRKDVEGLHETLKQQLDKLQETRANRRIDLGNGKRSLENIQTEITSLLTRKNRMPSDLIDVRERLLEALGVNEGELPFVGELIKVTDVNKNWEDAIERVLHNFSMQLLVPERFSSTINHFVHTNNIGTRLVYQRIDKKVANSLARWPKEEDSLLNKIEIKEGGDYSIWIRKQLVERFDFCCTDDLDLFRFQSKAVTSNGLMRNDTRHEKDDRPNNWSKLKYRLGWDNKDTIRILQEEKKRVEKDVSVLNEELSGLENNIGELSNRDEIIRGFMSINDFTEIDWQYHAIKIQEYIRQVEDLRDSSDKYKVLSEQLDSLNGILRQKRANKEDCAGSIKSTKLNLDELTGRWENIESVEMTEEALQTILTFIKEHAIAESDPSNLKALSILQKSFVELLGREQGVKTQLKHKYELEANKYITAFLRPHESIRTEFPDWTGDVMNIGEHIGSLDELEDLYIKIKGQRLVEHKKRFKEYMDRSMLDALTNFRTWLINEEEKIKEVVEELNVPLKKITFNKMPDTYLQLECRPNKAVDIKDFKEQLSATIPNVIEFTNKKDEAYRENVFNVIQIFIARLQKEDAWRRKVTDIRNWLTFNAREYTIEGDAPGHYHDNTASYSGGQKAQFTYAILGAAIAHQFGIFQVGRQHKSLRFIMVDEAFSKLDPEKSEFLMEFCAQLNLQILVVTPFDKINIVEPYISTVHYVQIKNKNDSVVYDIPLEEYLRNKDQFQQLAEASQ